MVSLLSFFLLAQVVISTEVDDPTIEGSPVIGTLTITHEKDQQIEPQNIQLEGESLQVEFVREVRLSADSDLVISIYNFTLPPKAKGLHVLPEVSVNVEGKEYLSFQRSYQVTERSTVESADEEVGVDIQAPVLRLVPVLEGDFPLYPGQRASVGYRMEFNWNIELTIQELPLLEARGFRRIGGKKIQESVQNGMNILQVTQEIEAVEPGDFQFERSIIEGRAYQESGGRRAYAKESLRADLDPMRIEVLPFREEVGFEGAVGSFTDFKVEMKGSSRIRVGERIPLTLTFRSENEDSVVVLPNLCCLPGFSGLLESDDLPPTEHVRGRTKQFNIALRPLSTLPETVPPIRFTFLDPKTREYRTLVSEPIAIEVVPIEKPEEEIVESQTEASPIEIVGNMPLTSADLREPLFSSPWWTLVIPIFFIFIYLQLKWRRSINETPLKASSETLFQNAMHARSLPLLKEAFLQLEPTDEIHHFLDRVDAHLYSEESKEQEELLFTEAETLFQNSKEAP
ncbi:MAG: hypothetical protein WD595_02730 [Waddliaceae bacterium]